MAKIIRRVKTTGPTKVRRANVGNHLGVPHIDPDSQQETTLHANERSTGSPVPFKQKLLALVRDEIGNNVQLIRLQLDAKEGDDEISFSWASKV